MSITVNERWEDFTKRCTLNSPGGKMYPYGYCYHLEDQCDNSKCPRQVYLTGETFGEAVARYNNISRADQILNG